MPKSPRGHDRKTSRLSWFDYSRVGVYFVTICTANRACRFGDVVDGMMQLNDAGRIVESVWNDLPCRYPQIELDAFVIVPDHIHGLIAVQPHPDTKSMDVTAAYPDTKSMDVTAAYPDTKSMDVGAIHELPLPPPIAAIADHQSPIIDNRVTRRRMLIPLVIGRLKMMSAKRINEIHGAPGQPLWQRGYYETVVRNERELERIRRYIVDNPRRWRSRNR